MPRNVAVTLSLLFTLTALSQTLTQEHRVVPLGPLTRAANAQFEPDIASDGHGFLAIWIDGRVSHTVYQSTGSLLWASHFAVDGTLTSAAGMKLADGVFDARIASNGTDYLIATRRIDGIYTQPFDDEGHALADAIRVDTAATVPMILASNGSSYLLTTNRQSAIQWQMLDRLGRPAGDPQVVSASNAWTNNAVVVTNDGVYHLIYGTVECVSGQDCSYGVDDVAVTNGHAVEPRRLVAPSSFSGYVAAASSGSRFLVAWVDATAIHEQLFDSDDNAVTTARTLGPTFDAVLTVGWDGARYLVTQSNAAGALGAQRVGADGELLDVTPFLITSDIALQPGFARGGGRVGIVWSAAFGTPIADVYGRVVFDFNELAATAIPPLRLSNAPSVQHAPAAASVRERTIRVWRAGDGNGSIEMAIDGGGAAVLSPENGDNQHDPDVAAIGDVALIVWRSDTHSLRRVLGVRVDANGNRLDQEPIVIDQDAPLAVGPALDRVSVATDGHAFLVAWSGYYVVSARRIAKDGSLIDAAPITASHIEYFVTAGVKALWTGTTYVVVFAFEDNRLTLHPPAMDVSLYAARISSSGVALDAAENRKVYDEFGATLIDLSAAAAGDRVVIAFSELVPNTNIDVSHCNLRTVEISADPPPIPIASHLTAQVAYPFTSGIPDLGIAVRGDTFLLAWSQDGAKGTQVRAQLLDRGESFVISEDDAYDVTVTPHANGFSLTYARTDPEADYVARLFTRDFVMTPGRHRAVQ